MRRVEKKKPQRPRDDLLQFDRFVDFILYLCKWSLNSRCPFCAERNAIKARPNWSPGCNVPDNWVNKQKGDKHKVAYSAMRWRKRWKLPWMRIIDVRSITFKIAYWQFTKMQLNLFREIPNHIRRLPFKWAQLDADCAKRFFFAVKVTSSRCNNTLPLQRRINEQNPNKWYSTTYS